MFLSTPSSDSAALELLASARRLVITHKPIFAFLTQFTLFLWSFSLQTPSMSKKTQPGTYVPQVQHYMLMGAAGYLFERAQ
jgi:hypothetical protein